MEVEELLQHIDIVEIASMFTDLEERGGEFWGLSPIKPEQTPSFSVRRESGKWFDFASGKGGGAVSLLQNCMHITAHEAIEKLKEIAGVDGDINITQRNKMEATICCKKYSNFLQKKKKESCTNKLPPGYMDQYELRWDKLKLWEEEGISRDALMNFGVKYDSFSNAIVYPIYNLTGDLVNVGIRTLDPLYKEKHIPKYIYRQSWNGGCSVVYGLWDNKEYIKAAHEVILFEGAKSVMKARDFGVRNCGALLTSHVSDAQMKILVKLGCDVVFMLDKEIDIHEDRNINRLKQYVNVYFYYDYEDLLEEKDSPTDKGQLVFRKLYEGKLRLK